MEHVHIVMIPFPAQGHVNPMMRLACRLALLNTHITFVCSERFVKSAVSSRDKQCEESIKVVEINKGTLSDNEWKGNVATVAAMEIAAAEMEAPFEEIVRGMMKVCSVGCIISDPFLSWTYDVAARVGLPRVVLWPTNATCCVVSCMLDMLVRNKYVPVREGLEKYGNIPVPGMPGVGNLMLRDLPISMQTADASNRLQVFERLKQAPYILASTFEELEEEAIAGMRTLVSNFLPVGPLLPGPFYQSSDSKLAAVGSSGAWEEDYDCIKWLDNQSLSSVVYISFGSLANLTAMQAQELAKGLQISNVAFIWVLRANLVQGLDQGFFQAFLEQTKGRGIAIPWAPQVHVLQHKAVSIFLTHCGWNSVTESICSGVPLIGWPCFAEQNLNCKYVAEEWKIGVGLEPGSSGEEIAKVICLAVDNVEIRENVRRLKQVARDAVQDAGSY